MYTDFTFWDEPRAMTAPRYRMNPPHPSHAAEKAEQEEKENGVTLYEVEEREVGAVVVDFVEGEKPRYNPPGKAHPGSPAEVEVEMFWIVDGERREMHEADFERLREEAESKALERAV